MTLSATQRAFIFLILALVMAGTRINHFAAIPDASWAVFFVAGFYLRGSWRWAFALLIAIAVLVDLLVISSQGLSFWTHYCVSPAYWFLLAAYGAMWAGGALLRRFHAGSAVQGLGLLAVCVLVSSSVCFLISNGSFYWLSSAVTTRSFSGWVENMGHWYFGYLRTSVMYVLLATGIHLVVSQLLRSSTRAAQISGRG
ncbi:MAG: hypothetical protein E6Q43_06445 [Dokdonella sp.]|nr:MAG: hypothetical protein EYC71_13175 [Gammaproteobacteria bacterium]TXI72555.1 MAG: hypothetical protein E6Q43_06445 [Dokdonella sp.]